MMMMMRVMGINHYEVIGNLWKLYKKNPLHSEVGIHVTGRRQLQDRSLPEDVVFVLFTEEAWI